MPLDLDDESIPLWWSAAFLCALSALLQALPTELHPLLRFEPDRALVEPWRAATGHLLHLSWGHWAMNAAGLVLLVALFGPWLRPARRLWLALAAAALAIDFGLALFDPVLRWYVGLSGALHGVWAAGALLARAEQPWFGWGALAVLIGKLAFEQIAGPLPGSAAAAGGAVIVDAHLYGAVGGALAGLLCARSHRRSGRDSAA